MSIMRVLKRMSQTGLLTGACLIASSGLTAIPAGAYAIIENDFSGSGSLRLDLDTSGNYYIRCANAPLRGTVARPPNEAATAQTWAVTGCNATKEGIELGSAAVIITRLPRLRAASASYVEYSRFEIDVEHFSRSGAICYYEVYPGNWRWQYSSTGGVNHLIETGRYTTIVDPDINHFPNAPSCPEVVATGSLEMNLAFSGTQFAVSEVPNPACDYLFSSSIKMSEMNTDLKLDAFQFAGDRNGYAWLSNGSRYTPVEGPIGTGFASAVQVRTGDINGEGDADIFLFTDEGNAYSYLSLGTSYSRSALLGTGFGRTCEMRIADMNGDRKDDILQFRSNGKGYAWLSNGTSYTYFGLIGTGFGSTYQDRIADIDGDGDDDILQILDTGVAYAWRADGTRYTGLGPIATEVGNSEVVRFGDKDGDGDEDLFRFTDDGEGYAWESNGRTYRALGRIGSGFGYVRQVRVADMNGDRRADIFKFEDTGIGYAWQATETGYRSLGQIGTGFGAP